jgi:hypothetical protein
MHAPTAHSFDAMPWHRLEFMTRRTSPTRTLGRVGVFGALAVLAACASATGRAPMDAGAGSPATLTASPCYVADTTSVAGTDTVRIIDPEPMRDRGPALDCAGKPIPEAIPRPPDLVVETLPPGTDLRDVLDGGLPGANGRRPDIVVTRDPDVLAYAAHLDDYFGHALPWNRTYVLIAADTESMPALPTADDRDALARDAVQGDARGARSPFPWLTDSVCLTPGSASGSRPPAILGYDARDPTARQLAERVLALATSGARPAWISAGLAGDAVRTRAIPHDSIAGELAGGRIIGAVTAEREALPADTLVREAPMHCGDPTSVPPGYAAVPLVDSRAHVLVRRGSGVAFFVTIDGRLWLTRRHAP